MYRLSFYEGVVNNILIAKCACRNFLSHSTYRIFFESIVVMFQTQSLFTHSVLLISQSESLFLLDDWSIFSISDMSFRLPYVNDIRQNLNQNASLWLTVFSIEILCEFFSSSPGRDQYSLLLLHMRRSTTNIIIIIIIQIPRSSLDISLRAVSFIPSSLRFVDFCH
jgi:hypothetical protein